MARVDAKLDVMVRFLTESHLDSYGGYEYDFAYIGNEVVVAELDDRKERAATKLARYPIAQLLRWHDEATKFRRLHKDLAFTDCLYETMPTFD